MTVPDWWTFVLLATASFRIWRLVAVDTITDGLRKKAYRWEAYENEDPALYRYRLDEFVACPWCFGFWICLAWWGAWEAWETGIEVASVPLALSAAVGIVARIDK